MPSNFILSFLRKSVTVLLYLLISFTLIFFIISVLNIAGTSNQATKLTGKTYSYEVMGFGAKSKDTEFIYSADSLVRYRGVKDHYTLQIEPNSLMGYYALIMRLMFLGLGIGVLWNFKKIFKETRLDTPFKHSAVKRLKILAALFIVSDVLKLTDYLLFNSFVAHSISSPQFELLTTIGDGLITGIIIWIIAVVYQRSLYLQEENALTI
jgi:hypothetical protein